MLDLTASAAPPCLGHDEPCPVVTEELVSGARDLRPFPGSTVLKFGPHVKVAEADTLPLVAPTAPSVPVPVVLHAYEKDGKAYILMSKMEGETQPSLALHFARGMHGRRRVAGSLLVCMRVA